MDIVKIKKFTWKIENFSTITDEELFSETFIVGGNKWRVLILFPKGNSVDHLSIYLDLDDSSNLHSGWSIYAHFGFAIINQFDVKTSCTRVTEHEFKANKADWGFTSFLALSELHNPEKGYLVNDACFVEAYVNTDRTKGLISHDLMVKSISVKYEIEEVDCVKANEHEEPNESVAVEPDDTTEEDISMFFTTLESELPSSNIVSSPEKAKEALDKLDEALSMTPDIFYHSGKFSSLTQVFNILASFDCSSTTITIEQKNELLAMEKSLEELAQQAAKAVEDKNCFTEKESAKMMITRNLKCSLTKYKEVEEEVKQVEQKLAALHEQVEEAQRKRKNRLAERKGIFKSSMKMKMELEELGNEWAKYEAKAKVAEVEEKTVVAKWGRMKDFISSLKLMI